MRLNILQLLRRQNLHNSPLWVGWCAGEQNDVIMLFSSLYEWSKA